MFGQGHCSSLSSWGDTGGVLAELVFPPAGFPKGLGAHLPAVLAVGSAKTVPPQANRDGQLCKRWISWKIPENQQSFLSLWSWLGTELRDGAGCRTDGARTHQAVLSSPGAISDSAAEAFCSFIPALRLFHALWLPREEEEC